MPDDENKAAMTVDEMQAFGEATKNAADKTETFNLTLSSLYGIVNTVGVIFKNATNDIIGLKQALEDTTLLTENQTVAFGALASGALAARKAFDFEDLNVGNIGTLEGTIGKLVENMVSAKAAIPGFEQIANLLGVTIPNAAKKSSAAAGGFLMNIMRNADNAARTQNAIMKLAAATGELGSFYKAAGDDLLNVNEIIAMHNRMLSSTEEATGALPETVEKYYTELGKVPGALNNFVRSSQNAEKHTNMLTATMQLAAGSGRNFSEIVEDLQTAFTHYDMVGEDALQFTARMGELSNKYNVQLNVVRDSLRSTAEQLRMFGHDGEGSSRIMEGAAKIMNQYTQALKDTGISGAAAVGIIGDITKQISGMDVASRSFVSAQTGGAGGLRGAFQIENLMREGKIDEVMEKVRQSMTQQFGKIVSVEEAAGSERAAAMLVKQRMMLQQGPLGNLVQNEQQAGRLLEAFRTKEEGTVTEALKPEIVQNTMGKGVIVQQQSLTELHHIKANTEALRRLASTSVRGGMGQLGIFGRQTAIQSGAVTAESDEARRTITSRAERAEAMGGEVGVNLRGIRTGTYSPEKESLSGWASLIEESKKFKEEIPKALEGPLSQLEAMTKSGVAGEAVKREEKELESLRREMAQEKSAERRAGLENQIKTKENQINAYKQWSIGINSKQKETPTNVGPQSWLTRDMNEKGLLETPPTAPQQVGAAAAKAAPVVAEGAEAKAANAATPAGTAEPQRVAGTIEVRVVVEGEDGSVRKEQRESISVGTRGA